MSKPKVSPYGSWKSPITSDLIVAKSVRLSEPQIEGQDIYWTELRPSEGGRVVVVHRSADGTVEDITPMGFNVRTSVHEYGGGAYTVGGGTVYFSNFEDQRLYRQVRGLSPEPITPSSDLRYADAVFDRGRDMLYCVREDHRIKGQEAVNTIVRLDPASEDGGQVILSGNNFYSTPRLSPDGSSLAWLTWNHPNMPWDGNELWMGFLNEDGSLGQSNLIAGGQDESIFQPEWSPDGKLYFVSDRSGWWNLYRHNDSQAEALFDKAAEFGLPQWVFGMSTYGFASASRLICSYSEDGISHLGSLDLDTGKFSEIKTPFTNFGSSIRVGENFAVFVGGSPTEEGELVQLDLPKVEEKTGQEAVFKALRRSSSHTVDPEYISVPRSVEFPTSNGMTAYAFFYPPKNPDFVAPKKELPPLLVQSHGGPTAATNSTLSLFIQYWTSRGFGVLDVNYGGSTGYGRDYRRRLNNQWGIVDVADCENAARYLVEQKEADPERLAIDGGSAGGYTTLCALTFGSTFKAGASYYGISDAEALATDTHKFESRYLDTMICPYPAGRDIYIERSPIHFTDRLAVPLILFQGLEDKVVPPSQAEKMFEAVKLKGIPVAYLPFEGEQHGFRKAENIKLTIDGEFYFYSKVFKFEPADQIEPIQIENL